MIRSACLALSLIVAAGPALAQSGEARRPVGGVDIIVKKNPGQSAKRVATNSAGRFVVRNLEPGSYSVLIGNRVVGRKTLTSGGTVSGTVTAPGGEKGIANKGTKGCDICLVAMD